MPSFELLPELLPQSGIGPNVLAVDSDFPNVVRVASILPAFDWLSVDDVDPVDRVLTVGTATETYVSASIRANEESAVH